MKPPRLCDECKKKLRRGEGIDHGDHQSSTRPPPDAV
jgi:hypothetical protein